MTTPPATYLRVRLTPRAGRDELRGWRDGELLAAVAAPPVDGKANEALRRLLASALRVPLSNLTIVSGGTARTKRLRVEGLTMEEVDSRLGRS